MKYPIFVLLCSEFAKIKLQTIVGCLKFISCENWALWIVNFVKPAEMLKTLSGNSGISDMDSFCFVYNLKYSKLHTILYITQIYIFTKILKPFIIFFWKKGNLKIPVFWTFIIKVLNQLERHGKVRKIQIFDEVLDLFVCPSLIFGTVRVDLQFLFLLNLVQNFHQSIGKLQ